MKTKTHILYIVLILLFFGAGFVTGRLTSNSPWVVVESDTTQKVEIDTLIDSMPKPIIHDTIGQITIPSPVRSVERIKYIHIIDTVIKTDTVKLLISPENKVRNVKFIDSTMPMPEVRKDSLVLPLERKVYEKDSVYRLSITGFRPNLEDITVYQKTITNTINNTVYPPKKNWVVSGGVGVMLNADGKIKPGIGITVGYKLFEF